MEIPWDDDVAEDIIKRFVPPEFIEVFEGLGYSDWCHFADTVLEWVPEDRRKEFIAMMEKKVGLTNYEEMDYPDNH
jgi:hypothetical protein